MSKTLAKFRVELIGVGQEISSAPCVRRSSITVSLEAQRKVKAPVAFSTMTNMSTGISFGASCLIELPRGSRPSLPRFIQARFHTHILAFQTLYWWTAVSC